MIFYFRQGHLVILSLLLKRHMAKLRVYRLTGNRLELCNRQAIDSADGGGLVSLLL